MKKTLLVLVVALSMFGCGRSKHVISVDRLLDCQEINVLYVTYAEPYSLATAGGKSSISRIVRGGAYYTLDLSKVEVSKREAESGETITVRLPQLKIEPQPDSFLSEEFGPRTKLLVNDTGLNRIREVYDEKDREKIKAGTNTPEYLKMAKEQSEKIIRKMLPELKVEIEWME